MGEQIPQNPREKLVPALKCDPGRIGLIFGMLAVIVMLLLRSESNGPASATASPIPVQAPTPSIPTDLPPAVVSAPVLNWLSQPIRPVERNLFVVPTKYYTRKMADAGISESYEDPAKSVQPATDQNKELQALMENLQSQASLLKLQSTMMGPIPCAMVNGELVKEGDTINGFKVVKIEPRRMMVERENSVLEIEMP